MRIAAVFTSLLAAATATPIFVEEFSPDWTDRWVKTGNSKFTGEFERTAGAFFGDAEDQAGVQTSANARHYGYSAKFAEPFDNRDKSLVVQFSVKHEQKLDCGGGYVKVLGKDVDQEDFNNDSEYSIMFGPDMCGPSNRKVHLIFNYKGKNLLWKKKPTCKTDQLTHLYTMILNPDNTYEVQIDQEKIESGKLEEDWDFLEPKEIADPDAKQPEDWVTEAMIVDKEDKKPDDWDDEPEFVEDENASEPSDWDEEEDGEWERPKIKNPKYKGEWKAKMIPNPDYKGPWEAPKIANPKYVADDDLYHRGELAAVGFDLWQVTAGSIFDNVIVTDSVEEAKEHGEKHWKAHAEAEKAAFDKQEEEKKKEAEEKRKAAEEEARKAKEEESKKDDDDEDDDDEDGDNEQEKEEL